MEAILADLERIIWEGWFSIVIPNGWQVDESDGAISIFDPAGYGAITISLFSLTEMEAGDACAIAQSFATQRGWEIAEDKFLRSERNSSSVCSFDYQVKGDVSSEHWEVIVLRTTDRAALMSYMCALSAALEERSQRHQVFESFAWESIEDKH